MPAGRTVVETSCVPRGRAGRPAGSGAVDPLPDGLHRRRGGDVRVPQEERVGHVDAGDADLVELLLGRLLEEVLPKDVARDEAPHLDGEVRPGRIRVLRARCRAERIAHRAQPVRTKLERLEHVGVLVAEMPRRIEVARVVRDLVLLPGEARKLALDVGLLLSGRGEERVELAAQPLGLVRVVPDGRHVIAVRVLALVLTAAVHPEDEQEHDQDRETDQADEPKERRQARGRPDRGPRPRRRGRSSAVSLVSGSSKKSNSMSFSLITVRSGSL